MKFCEKLQKLRKEKGYSQEQLADMLDVSRQSVSKWESGTTYPEMDKLLMLCKIFNITLDDLTNDEVTDTTIKEKNKGTFNNVIYAVLEMISKSVEMFKNMNKKELSKCISELIIVVILLMFCAIPFSYVDDLARNIFINFGSKAFSIMFSIWKFFTSIIYLVLFVTVLVYVFKTRYLDKFDFENIKVAEEDIEEEKSNHVEEKKSQEKSKRKNAEHNFILFDVLGSIFNLVVKFCLLIFIVPIIVVFFCLAFATILAVILFIKGITYPGIIIALFGCTILSGLIMEIGIQFLVNAQLKFQRLFWIFVSGLLICCVGSAVATFEIAETEFINEAPSSVLKTTENFTFTMKDGYYLDTNYYYCGSIRYEVDEAMEDNVVVTIDYYADFISLNVEDLEDRFLVVTWDSPYIVKTIYNLAIDNLKEKKLYDYSELYEIDLVVYASSENVNKLKNNGMKQKEEAEKKRLEEQERYYEIEYQNYQREIDKLTRENEQLKVDLKNALDKQDELEAKIQEIESLLK